MIFGVKFSIIRNKLNIEYKKQETLTFAIYDLRVTIFSFLPRSPHEIGTAGISQGKSAKNEKFELKNAKMRVNPVFIGVHPMR